MYIDIYRPTVLEKILFGQGLCYFAESNANALLSETKGACALARPL